jgi:hypothetical protein
MNGVVEPRAPAVIAKLDGELAKLAAMEAGVDELALAAAENQPGAIGRLTAQRAKIEEAERRVSEMRRAVALAQRIDRQADAAAATQMRAGQLVEFKRQFAAREKAMATVLKAAADMAAAYGEYSEATLLSVGAIPSGTFVPPMSIGRDGLYGAAFGPCDRLILGELFRLAPDRHDGTGRFVLPFAKPPSEMARGKPETIPAGIDEMRAADDAIIADISKQIENLDEVAMRFALAVDRKDHAA